MIEETNRHGVVVKEEAYDRLALVFTGKIRNSEQVSALTVVGGYKSSNGSKVQGMVKNSCELLAKCGIDVLASATGKNDIMLLLKPDLVEKAANIIHNNFIVSEEVLEEQQELAVS